MAAMPPETCEGAGPDWSLIQFPVKCPRCDHDLRGTSKPTCAQCKLEFAWADLIPIDELKCLNCRYPLFGLPQQRCPECGTEFTWTELLLEWHRRSLFLFEYWWRRKPIRSAVWTWWKTLRPGRFWTMVKLHHPPQGIQLILFAGAGLLLSLIACLLGSIVGQVLSNSYSSWRFGNSIWSGFTPGSLSTYLPSFRDVAPVFVFAGTWLASALLSLMILVGSMRRLGLRMVHLLRIWAYSLPVWVPAIVFFQIILSDTIWVFNSGRMYRRMETLFNVLLLAALLFSVWSLRQGLKRYVKMPHATAVAISVQIIAALSTMLVSVVGVLLRLV